MPERTKLLEMQLAVRCQPVGQFISIRKSEHEEVIPYTRTELWVKPAKCDDVASVQVITATDWR